jgi:phosphoribosyl-AMP cyclohydrolase
MTYTKSQNFKEKLTEEQFLKLTRVQQTEYREYEKQGWIKRIDTFCWGCDQDAGIENVLKDGSVFCDDYPNCSYN